MEETKCKGNESALEDKVKHIVPEELNSISNEILNKVTSQERDCYRNNLLMEMESSNDDLELLRKSLEDRWHEIHQEILAKGLLERSESLSDGGHDAVKCIPGQHVNPPTPVALPFKSTLRPVAQHHNYKGDFIRKKDAQMSLIYTKDNLDKTKSKAKDALTDNPAAKTNMPLCYGQMNTPAAGKAQPKSRQIPHKGNMRRTTDPMSFHFQKACPKLNPCPIALCNCNCHLNTSGRVKTETTLPLTTQRGNMCRPKNSPT